jgi:hypothetical protein
MDARVGELAEMLGAFGESGKQSAREIIEEAIARKAQLGAAFIPAPKPSQTSLL